MKHIDGISSGEHKQTRIEKMQDTLMCLALGLMAVGLVVFMAVID